MVQLRSRAILQRRRGIRQRLLSVTGPPVCQSRCVVAVSSQAAILHFGVTTTPTLHHSKSAGAGRRQFSSVAGVHHAFLNGLALANVHLLALATDGWWHILLPLRRRTEWHSRFHSTTPGRSVFIHTWRKEGICLHWRILWIAIAWRCRMPFDLRGYLPGWVAELSGWAGLAVSTEYMLGWFSCGPAGRFECNMEAIIFKNGCLVIRNLVFPTGYDFKKYAISMLCISVYILYIYFQLSIYVYFFLESAFDYGPLAAISIGWPGPASRK